MTKFLVMWRRNMLAPWPTDRREITENTEAMFEAIERYMDAGIVTENGFFIDGDSGCFIFEGASEDIFKMTSMFDPYIHDDVKEIIPYEIWKDTILESVRSQAQRDRSDRREGALTLKELNLLQHIPAVS